MNESADAINTFLVPSIKSLADVEYQKRVWLLQEGTEVDSYEESLEIFFGVYELLYESSEMEKLSVPLRKELHALYVLIDAFDDTVGQESEEDVEKILSHPKWKEIRQKAEEFLVKCSTI